MKPKRIEKWADLSTDGMFELGYACQEYVNYLDNDEEYHEEQRFYPICLKVKN